MKKLFYALSGIVSFAVLGLSVMSVGAVDVLEPTCQHFTGDKPGICQDNETAQTQGDRVLFGPNGILTLVVNIFSLVLGFAAVIVIMIAAVRFISANGDPQTIASSRNTIIFAVLGLALAGLAQAIVQLVLSKLGG